MSRLIFSGAFAAGLGGAGRMLAGFWPLAPGSVAAELAYGVIDICFVLGIIAICLSTEAHLGWRGQPAFLLALAGAAILAGPDGTVAGISGFTIGAGLMLTSLAAAGLLLLWRDRRYAVPGSFWIGGLILALTGEGALAGFLTGAGFFGAGYVLLREAVSAPVSSSRGLPGGRS